MPRASAILLLISFLGCSGEVVPEADLVVDDVSVLDVETGQWQEDRAIYVDGGRIAAILDAGSEVPAGAEVIAGGGRYVIPGLWDAHVHSVTNRGWHFRLLLAHGVTAVRNMHSSEPDPLSVIDQVREEVRSGVLPPIRMIANGALVDGAPARMPGSIEITDPEEAPRLVDSLVAAGADFIKVYDNVSGPVFEALLDAARDRGIAVDGHVPFGVPMQSAAIQGMRAVEHVSGLTQGCSSAAAGVAEEYRAFSEGPELPFPAGDSTYFSLIRRLADTEDEALCAELIDTYVQTGIAASPTLVNGISMGDPARAMAEGTDVLPPDLRAQWEAMAGPGPGDIFSAIMAPVTASAPRHVRALHEAGVPILAGTDIGNLFIVPGASLQREIRLLHEAGLPELDAIRAATRTPAEVFGLADSLGLTREGFVADFVILEDDPLADIQAIGSIWAVVSHGEHYSRARLDALLEGVQRSPDDFSPAAFAAACEAWDDWDKPAPPFRIYGDTYHVGTCGISALLITSPDGHLVIDTGTEVGADVVAANIERLGFSLGDVRYLTHTQEHHDHMGGLARLAGLTGARVISSERARSVVETGVLNTDDPQYEPHDPMATVPVDQVVADGEAISLADKQVVANYTPGHSPGAISWRWVECEEEGEDGEGGCRSLVFTDGMGPFSADGYRWSDQPDYLADYRASLTWLETVEAEICLAAHPSQMRLIERIETGNIVDPGLCSRSGASIKERVGLIVAEEGPA